MSERRLPRGIRNNNPGNIRKTAAKWLGETDGSDDAFETFITAEAGLRAMARILLTYQRKHRLRTVRSIIARWAPPVENDTGSYETQVSAALRVDPREKLDLEKLPTLVALMQAITRHENGMDPYDPETYAQAARRAQIS